MTPAQFQPIAANYPHLHLAIVGDFCLDRYLEIDPARAETSLETGLPVHNVVRVRSQPGGAGTVLNNLVALGVGRIEAVGLAGEDGEGYELWQALKAKPAVGLEHFLRTPLCHTFTYSKPLIVEPGKAPVELNRLDIKNWSVTPPAVEAHFRQAVRHLADRVDAFILLEQVDQPDTGVLTRGLLAELGALAKQWPKLLVLADSRRGLSHFPPFSFKMNAAELARLLGTRNALGLEAVKQQASALATGHHHRVFVTLAEQGMIGAEADGQVKHMAAWPVRGEIDIVGAGDAVTANLAAALAAGANLDQALAAANAAASIVIHQLGTTGTATVAQISELLASER